MSRASLIFFQILARWDLPEPGGPASTTTGERQFGHSSIRLTAAASEAETRRSSLPEADWCCGSAGVYNITQPETSMRLLDRKMANIGKAGAQVVVSGNPGCTIQLIHGASRHGSGLEVAHPVSLLAAAYRAEEESR